MAPDGEQVGAEVIYFERQPPGGLDGVGVEKRGRFMSGGSDFGDGLNYAGFIVGVHHAHQSRVGAERSLNLRRRNDSFAVRTDISDREALRLQTRAGVENGGMFDGARDNVAAGMEARDAEDGEIIGFGSAAVEYDLARSAADRFRDLPARRFKRAFRRLTEVVNTGSVPVSHRERLRVKRQNFRMNGSGRVMVEINVLH